MFIFPVLWLSYTALLQTSFEAKEIQGPVVNYERAISDNDATEKRRLFREMQKVMSDSKSVDKPFKYSCFASALVKLLGNEKFAMKNPKAFLTKPIGGTIVGFLSDTDLTSVPEILLLIEIHRDEEVVVTNLLIVLIRIYDRGGAGVECAKARLKVYAQDNKKLDLEKLLKNKVFE